MPKKNYYKFDKDIIFSPTWNMMMYNKKFDKLIIFPIPDYEYDVYRKLVYKLVYDWVYPTRQIIAKSDKVEIVDPFEAKEILKKLKLKPK